MGQQAVIKPFSLQLYADNDNAKELVIRWLEAQGFTAWVNPDEYGIDLIFHNKDGDYYYAEVEVKHNWEGVAFPFKSIHFPKRKLKFANPRSVFIMLNKDRSQLIVIPGKKLLKSPIITKNTIYTENEEFIEVQL